MITQYDVPEKYAGMSMQEAMEEFRRNAGMKSIDEMSAKQKIDVAIDVLKASPILGTITGSCLLPTFDPDGWGTTPDVDVFVFSEYALVHAVSYAMYKLGMKPGKTTQRSRQQEEWKLHRLFEVGLNRKIGITTYTFEHAGVMVNITYKMRKDNGKWVPLMTTPDVLSSFDMSIVMQGLDIQKHLHYDMRIGDPMVATPNPLRNQDCVMWTVAKWVRQFDRVVKYYNRGFDTRPMAKFYIEMIDDCLETGCLFDSDESHEMFDTYSEDFKAKREQIAAWLEAHEED